MLGGRESRRQMYIFSHNSHSWWNISHSTAIHLYGVVHVVGSCELARHDTCTPTLGCLVQPQRFPSSRAPDTKQCKRGPGEKVSVYLYHCCVDAAATVRCVTQNRNERNKTHTARNVFRGMKDSPCRHVVGVPLENTTTGRTRRLRTLHECETLWFVSVANKSNHATEGEAL